MYGREYSIKVNRTNFQHKKNPSVKLTLDKATYEDGSTFVVFSIVGNVHSPINSVDHKEAILESVKPCRSKIIELLFRTQKSLYQSLCDAHHVDATLDYQSITIEEFEKKRRERAEKLKKEMQEDNENLPPNERCSAKVIEAFYRLALLNGYSRRIGGSDDMDYEELESCEEIYEDEDDEY